MPGNQKQKMVVIVGPTASGKSDLGIFLAQKFNGEIISADSRQVYRGMNIGTGKISKKEQGKVKHHLLDVANPKKVFTVSDFKKLSQKALNNIKGRGKIPFIVGGTGFYIDALIRDIPLPKVLPNKKLRAELAKQSAEQLFRKLKKFDPERAKTIDAKNKVRLIRALEILESGRKIPSLTTNYQLLSTSYNVLWLGLKPKNINKRIEFRLEKRLKQGMAGEVQQLHKEGVSWRRLDNLGLEYRWLSRYLNKDISYKEMKKGLLRDIIKYSKRQMTWFKRNKEIFWVKNNEEAARAVRKFLFS